MPAARPVILLAAASLMLTVPPTLAATVVPNPSNVSCTGPTEAAATGQGLVSPAADGNGVTSAPGPVRNLAVTALDGAATVTWDAPATDPRMATGKPLSYYLRTDPFGEYTKSVAAVGQEGCTILGLTNGTTYTVSVAARYPHGQGPATVSEEFTPRPAGWTEPAPHPAGTPAAGKKKKAKRATVRLGDAKHRRGHTLSVRWTSTHAKHVQLTWRRGRGKPHTQRTAPSGRLTLAGPPGTRYTITVRAGKSVDKATYRIR